MKGRGGHKGRTERAKYLVEDGADLLARKYRRAYDRPAHADVVGAAPRDDASVVGRGLAFGHDRQVAEATVDEYTPMRARLHPRTRFEVHAVDADHPHIINAPGPVGFAGLFPRSLDQASEIDGVGEYATESCLGRGTLIGRDLAVFVAAGRHRRVSGRFQKKKKRTRRKDEPREARAGIANGLLWCAAIIGFLGSLSFFLICSAFGCAAAAVLYWIE
jgi:hypothetical protein